MNSDYILKSGLTEKQKRIVEQLTYSVMSLRNELGKEGFSFSYLAEHSDAINKYFHILQKEFRI